MKVLSLSQPWASLLFAQHKSFFTPTAAKAFETRGWKPSAANLAIIQRDRLLIHASETWKPTQAALLQEEPFKWYFDKKEQMPFGAIIGMVKVDKIISTDEWLVEFADVEGSILYWQEKAFGDYSSGRWA